MTPKMVAISGANVRMIFIKLITTLDTSPLRYKSEIVMRK